ncbi:MAG: thiol oxidoreductase [Planctomycetes bacterium]|nr:thiol oxidoreductase [Planctomycetota bacterium]
MRSLNLSLLGVVFLASAASAQSIGQEVSIGTHLADGAEFSSSLSRLLQHGRALFSANWTSQEGAGRPLSDGTGGALSDPSSPLVGARSFNRISGPDANSCAACHNAPFGAPGGGGDFVGGVFVLGQRFDFVDFDPNDMTPLRGRVDENGQPVALDELANFRASIGMYGAGYIELLARQMTAELQARRDALAPGSSVALVAKGISFGQLARGADGSYDASAVTGLSAGSVATPAGAKPSLVLKPFHQAGAVTSLRQFSNNAFNHHHGIQTVERFGASDVDGDGFTTEMTVADVTAVTLFQATLPVPGRVIPDVDALEAAISTGEQLFVSIGCATCHVPELPLSTSIFSEPSPYSPAGNLALGDAYVAQHGVFSTNLNHSELPKPRLVATGGVTKVPAFTDLKLHDITAGPNDPNRESLDMHAPGGSAAFRAGNAKFLTKKLWGCANEAPYFHHGRFTTLREAVVNHFGEADASRLGFLALDSYGRDCVIEFLKSLQILPSGTQHRIVDERMRPRDWPPFPGTN